MPLTFASTVKLMLTVVLAPAAKLTIGVFNVAIPPNAVQFASAKVKPAGI